MSKFKMWIGRVKRRLSKMRAVSKTQDLVLFAVVSAIFVSLILNSYIATKDGVTQSARYEQAISSVKLSKEERDTLAKISYSSKVFNTIGWNSLETVDLLWSDRDKVDFESVNPAKGAWLFKYDSEAINLVNGGQLADIYIFNGYSVFKVKKAQYLEAKAWLAENSKKHSFRLNESLTSILAERIHAQNMNSLWYKVIYSLGAAFDFVFSATMLQILFYAAMLYFMARSMPSMSGKKEKVIYPEENPAKIDDLLGMDEVKREVRIAMQSILASKKLAEAGVKKDLNIVFSGPAGTGKTRLAMALAAELNVPLITMAAANLETGFVAGGANALMNLYNNAKSVAANHPSKTVFVFLDEAQSLFGRRGRNQGGAGKYADDTPNAFLTILEGAEAVKDVKVIWICASNFDSTNMEIDEAMSRRFPVRINFRLPNARERKQLFELYFAKSAKNIKTYVDLDYIAQISEGLSGAYIENTVEKSVMTALMDNQPITTELVAKTIETLTIGLTSRKMTEGMTEAQKIIAYHETGHFIANTLRAVEKLRRTGNVVSFDNLRKNSKVLKISIESLPHLNALGYQSSVPDGRYLKSKLDFEDDIVGLYGGRAVEEVFFGKENVTGGSANDIEKVSDILRKLTVNCGFYSDVDSPLNYEVLFGKENSLAGSDDTGAKILATINKQSQRLYAETISIVSNNKQIIEIIAETLLEKYVLDSGQLFDLIERNMDKIDWNLEPDQTDPEQKALF